MILSMIIVQYMIGLEWLWNAPKNNIKSLFTYSYSNQSNNEHNLQSTEKVHKYKMTFSQTKRQVFDLLSATIQQRLVGEKTMF